jgi:uncharacterized membrane protein YfcA
MLEELALYLGFGCVAGVLSGLLGIGGGVVIVPFLVWYFSVLGFPSDAVMIMAVATSLATIVVTSLSAAHAHHGHGAVDWGAVGRLAPGILAGSALGSVIADHLPARWFKGVFAVFLLTIALSMLMRPAREAIAGATPDTRRFGWVGALIGALSSILGIGGGALSVPFLVRRGYLLRRAVAISSACGFPIAAAGTAAYVALGWSRTGLPSWSLGYVYLPALAGIMMTSVPFAPLGAHLAHRWPVRRLRMALAVIIALGGAKLLWQALSL